MTATRDDKIQAIRDYIEWTYKDARSLDHPDHAGLIVEYAAEALTPCDTAIATGPGHQSVHPCIVTGPHSEHGSDHGYEWSDSDVTLQTGSRTRYEEDADGRRTVPVKTTYRLAFGDY